MRIKKMNQKRVFGGILKLTLCLCLGAAAMPAARAQGAASAITEQEATSHPSRNLLTQAVGTNETVDIQIMEFALAPGDRLLVSSDGLHAIIGNKAIDEILTAAKEPAAAVRELIAGARDQGGPDNISCIVIDYG